MIPEAKEAIKGLMFRDVKAEPVLGDDGKPKKDRDGKAMTRNVPYTRTMAEADLLDAKMIPPTGSGQAVCVLVSKDGMKYRMPVKSGGAPVAPQGGGGDGGAGAKGGKS